MTFGLPLFREVVYMLLIKMIKLVKVLTQPFVSVFGLVFSQGERGHWTGNYYWSQKFYKYALSFIGTTTLIKS